MNFKLIYFDFILLYILIYILINYNIKFELIEKKFLLLIYNFIKKL